MTLVKGVGQERVVEWTFPIPFPCQKRENGEEEMNRKETTMSEGIHLKKPAVGNTASCELGRNGSWRERHRDITAQGSRCRGVRVRRQP